MQRVLSLVLVSVLSERALSISLNADQLSSLDSTQATTDSTLTNLVQGAGTSGGLQGYAVYSNHVNDPDNSNDDCHEKCFCKVHPCAAIPPNFGRPSDALGFDFLDVVDYDELPYN